MFGWVLAAPDACAVNCEMLKKYPGWALSCGHAVRIRSARSKMVFVVVTAQRDSAWQQMDAVASVSTRCSHDDVIRWKHFPRYWPFVRGIHRSPVSSPHKGQWRGVWMFSLICPLINGWVNTHEASDLRRHRTHCEVTAMFISLIYWTSILKLAIFQLHIKDKYLEKVL